MVISIEIRGVYDGVAFEFNKETGEFTWRQVVIERTTEEFRKDYEHKFKKSLNL